MPQINPTALIALVGWGLTALGWWVSQRAQRRQLRHQIMNTARGEIVAALRREQDVVGSVAVDLMLIGQAVKDGSAKLWDEGRWRARFEEFQSTSARSDGQWIFVLEQYESVFPATRAVRRQLVAREKKYRLHVANLFLDFAIPSKRSAAIERLPFFVGKLQDTAALIEDLLVYVQNQTLGEIFGSTVPFRQPLDSKVPRIVLAPSGDLTIRFGEADDQTEA